MYYNNRKYISWFNFSDEKKKAIIRDIERESKDYILNVNEDEFKKHVIEKHLLEPLEIVETTKKIHPPAQKEREGWTVSDRARYNKYYYECKISLKFTGDKELWNVTATTFSLSGKPEMSIRGDELTYIFEIEKQDPEEFKRESEYHFNSLMGTVNHLKNDVIGFNREVSSIVHNTFLSLKSQYLRENDFFRAINVTQSDSSLETYAVPVINKKRTISKPDIEKRSYVTNPVIDDVTYTNIISCLHQTGASMEKKPSLYVGKGEEAIRDFFLVQLELRFEGGTTTGETFNRGGKTDILLKNTDGTNLFVGECKIWKGEKVFFDTISQLLNYLTWQDSKTSILFFVKNESIVKVVDTVKSIVSRHENFILKKGETDRSVSCIFKLPQDPYKQIKCEIILFHFEK